jgi:His/Glu/Gln/Arg/opine family amino acid ABC transporter permease subunit
MPFLTDYLDVLIENNEAIWDGLMVTLQLLLGSCAIGFLLSIPLGIARATATGWLRSAVFVYSSLFRGTPLLVQIFIFYYGLSQFEFIQDSFLWPVLGDSFYCGLVVLTLSLSAYTAENIRAGIMAVPPGEIEAARAYGLTTLQRYRYIVIPQALRIVTPVLGNDIISQMKSTALVSTITVIDLTGVVRRLSARTYTTDALVIAAVIYALMALLISILVRRVEMYNLRPRNR